MSDLPAKLIAIHRALEAGRIPHAFGGAIALAYWTRDPRGTSDIDLNLFLPADQAARGLGALPSEVEWTEAEAKEIARAGQGRLFWDRTPVDLFFSYAEIHDEALRNRRTVEFAGAEIPVLGPIELAVFKAWHSRTRDWADIEQMLAAEALDVEAVEAHLTAMVGADDGRLTRLAAAVERVRRGDAV